MGQDKHEAYDEAHREIIEGLRRLADAVETPQDLGRDIMARAPQLLPARQTRRLWWTQRLGAWQLRPLVWGPVIALVCFVAGTFVSRPYPGSSRLSQTKKRQNTALNSSRSRGKNPLPQRLRLPARRYHDRRHRPPGTRPSYGMHRGLPPKRCCSETPSLSARQTVLLNPSPAGWHALRRLPHQPRWK